MADDEKPGEKSQTAHIEIGSIAGVLWSVVGWMFTNSFAKLIWWKALLALVILP